MSTVGKLCPARVYECVCYVCICVCVCVVKVCVCVCLELRRNKELAPRIRINCATQRTEPPAHLVNCTFRGFLGRMSINIKYVELYTIFRTEKIFSFCVPSVSMSVLPPMKLFLFPHAGALRHRGIMETGTSAC